LRNVSGNSSTIPASEGGPIRDRTKWWAPDRHGLPTIKTRTALNAFGG
jgi:hypothetical protein